MISNWRAKRKRKTRKNDWRMLDDARVPAARGFGLLGILNLTPDSFFDGGKYNLPRQALARAGALLAEGADVLDLGAESTRPGARAIGASEEVRRLLPALCAIRKMFPDAAISVDTRNSVTARAALEAGCQIINDVSACRHDPLLLDVLAQYKPGYILMHCQGVPETMQRHPGYGDVLTEVLRFFETELNRLVRAGLPENRIMLDPGIGFGKKAEHNRHLLREIGAFLQFGRPVMVGISMKSSLAALASGSDAAEATAIASALLYAKGVAWHRVHEPGRAGKALALCSALV